MIENAGILISVSLHCVPPTCHGHFEALVILIIVTGSMLGTWVSIISAYQWRVERSTPESRCRGSPPRVKIYVCAT